MSKEVAGIALEDLEEPIMVALESYQDFTGGKVQFDVRNAGKLLLTPDKPNSARSTTEVTHLGERMGDLYVIAFKPGDGTGDGKVIGLDDVDTGRYPRRVGVVPRPKTGIHAESHLTIVSQHIDTPNSDPVLFVGSLSLLGLLEGRVVRLGQLGQPDSIFSENMSSGSQDVLPTATYTVGYKDEVRFGDPHSVFNNHPGAVQVCGFLAFTNDLADRHQATLALLGSELPN